MRDNQSSALPGYYRLPLAQRQAIAADWAGLGSADIGIVAAGGLSMGQAEQVIENVIGRFSLPFAVATNFTINGRDYLVPMVIEEPSVVAACSYAAKLFREGGGFQTSSDPPVMIGQIQLLDLAEPRAAEDKLRAQQADILAAANARAGSILARGGGAIGLEYRHFRGSPVGDMLVLHLLFDCRDAMGANAINSALEHIAPLVERITGGRVNLRILSNLSDRRMATARGVIPAKSLATKSASGAQVLSAIIEAGAFAECDAYRAATHNKGIMNGIDAVVLATGNDWRAVEAGAHAYAARDGRYTSLTRWWRDDSGDLHGEIALPLALGIVGGATRAHPAAKIALRLLGVESARGLAEVAAAVGLAQNFAALRALATDGIQSGHMRMHARQLALAAGATGEEVMQVARQLIDEGNIRLERAKELTAGGKRNP
ncbi:MAG: hydroxymethylglutaryl-CoA reductase, degradative [Chloroflexi bacterium]|nr:hydroxymethylglutaryl-CoA reductase, degradative [Chloroflexota bacterium]MCY3581432.1 hydroxymethylglutaryl-CoA reductase, degradative [Chloroflexota bacterium]MCY3717283.1 hydroxymethylglutaryl-CoA reductase, degradative [Chloroflexota bacterium]MDE2649200.1 hydroxymethylglutaryl-CoA reductase, degradative [Chloroflexota bacterium]MXV93174.1 hydroxymethylglutaryl-CoA reductase, degradative [Chloroflexota bacterium]